MVFRYRPGSRLSGDAQAVGERLEALRQRHGNGTGELDPKYVVQDAKNRNSPMHNLFTWDDTEAAAKWRLTQASHLLVCVIKETTSAEGEKVMTRAYVSVKRPGRKRKSFVAIESAMRDPLLREQVLERAWEELQVWRAKYQHYEELFGIIKAIDEEQAVLES